MAERRFEVVADDETPAAQTEPARDLVASNMLVLALKALSQRAVVAIANLFTLLTVFSAFVLWYKLPDPNVLQIVALTIYAAFILAANTIVRRF